MTSPFRLRATRCFAVSLLATALISLASSPIVAQGTSWNGTISSNWRTSGNWSQGVPDSTKSTTVSVGIVNGKFDLTVPAPISGDTARVGSLTIQNDGSISFATSPSPGILIVHGSVFSLNGGVVLLNNGRVVFKDDVQFNNGGSFDAGTGTLEFQGDVDAQSGSGFLPDSSTVVFNGNGDQTVTGDLQFYNLIVETGGTLSLTGTIEIQGTVTVESGATLYVEPGSTFVYEGEVQGEGDFINDGLPVQLTQLSSVSNGSSVLLQWSTATEVNNFGFAVERREVGRQSSVTSLQFDAIGWVKVGFVQGSGTSSTPREYSYVDANVPPGRHAYRLVQVDFDGSSNTSFETEVDVLTPRVFGIGANYPNPFNPQTTLDYSVATAGFVKIFVYDLQGREVATLVNRFVPAGNYKVQWNATSMASGVYHAVMNVAGRRWTKSMVLTK